MINVMTKFGFNKAMYFFLVVAMLSMQWSTNHIHLAEHHNHDGNHHQHNIEVHSHQSITQNNQFVAGNELINDHQENVIEIDNDCRFHKGNTLKDQATILTLATTFYRLIPQLVHVRISKLAHSKRRYLDYSTIHLRAPPQLS